MSERLTIGGLSLDGDQPPFEVLAHQAVPLGRGEPRRFLDVVVPLVASAVVKHGRGEVVGYEVVLQAMPNPPLPGQQEPQWNPMALILVDIAPIGGMDNRILNVSNALPPTAAGWDPAAVDAIVGAMLDGCFTLRAQQLDQLSEQVREGTTGPMQRSPQGLILP